MQSDNDTATPSVDSIIGQLPATETQLAEFIAYPADVIKAAPTTIKTYMAAVRSLHTEHGHGNPFADTLLLHRVFTGVKRTVGTGPRMVRLPITVAVFHRIITRLLQRTT